MAVKAKTRPIRFSSKLKDPLDVKKIIRIKPTNAAQTVRKFRAKSAVFLSTEISLNYFLISHVSSDLSVCN